MTAKASAPRRAFGDRDRAAFVFEEFYGPSGQRPRREAENQMGGIPIQVRVNGLLPTLAHHANRRRELVRLVARWLDRCFNLGLKEGSDAPERAIFRILSEGGQPEYLAMQREAVALLSQAKLIASAAAADEVEERP